MKRLFAMLALAVCLPAGAQDLAATLRVNGDVRISMGADFVPATDKQPIVVGQRILVGENATAKVVYGRDCSRSYGDPGVYTVGPADCRKDKKRKDQQQQQAGTEGTAGASGGTPLVGTLSTVLGTVLAGQQSLEHRKDSEPDRALSH
jgi:hypothetical protein